MNSLIVVVTAIFTLATHAAFAGESLIAMARFVQANGINPADGQSGCYIAFDTGPAEYIPNIHFCTSQWVDILVRGYRLTADRALLDRAKLHWQRGSGAPGPVGRFVNSVRLSGNTPFYRWNGDLTYTHLMFYDDVRLATSGPSAASVSTAPASTSTSTTSLTSSTAQSTQSVMRSSSTAPVTQSPPASSAPPTVQPSPAATPTPALANVPDNSWVKLQPVASQRFNPRNATPSDVLETQANPSARAFGGIHYGDGKVWYFGGGHGGYPGNDVEVYDIAGNRWTQSYKPEVCNPSDKACNGIYGGWGVPVLTPLERPYTEHTYQKLGWDPVSKRLIGMLTGGTFAYDPATTKWVKIAPPLIGFDIYTWNLLPWDPDLGAFVGIVTGQQNPGVYKLTSQGWTRVGNVPTANNNDTAYSAYMPDQHAHLIWMKRLRSFWKFDARTVTWKQITSMPSEAVAIDSIAYDTKNRVVIGVEHSEVGTLKVWAYTPATDTWVSVPVGGSFPSQPAGIGAWAPLLVYDPVNNIFIFLAASGGSGRTETWLYRYRR